MALLLGFDIGTSSIKASLLDGASGRTIASATSPDKELPIEAPRPGWAEQDPESWWTHTIRAARMLAEQAQFNAADVAAIGISYQMHGLVLVDAAMEPIRPAIIWCDSRAVASGDELTEKLGEQRCMDRMLNLPGNFTASKLHWVKHNEPENYARIAKTMLPGDFVALRMTGQAQTTPSGLSEGILWDFQESVPAKFVLEAMDVDPAILPEVVPTFGVHAELTAPAADALGLKPGTPVAYRAGDQPNNALSLNVLEPGEAAVTAGTSGVVYGIADAPCSDPQSRVNPFLHVNSSPDAQRLGVLLCINGTGILNSWLRAHVAVDLDYPGMDRLAETAPAGAEGLRILPFGNGAERILGNRDIGASLHGWDFNRHRREHILRAAQEGIVFALGHGVNIMHEMGLGITTVRAGKANMFLSKLFAESFATVTGATVELYDTDGALGAARGAGIGAGVYASPGEAFAQFEPRQTIEPNDAMASALDDAFADWERILEVLLSQ